MWKWKIPLFACSVPQQYHNDLSLCFSNPLELFLELLSCSGSVLLFHSKEKGSAAENKAKSPSCEEEGILFSQSRPREGLTDALQWYSIFPWFHSTLDAKKLNSVDCSPALKALCSFNLCVKWLLTASKLSRAAGTKGQRPCLSCYF